MTPVMEPDKKGEFDETDPLVRKGTNSFVRRVKSNENGKKESWLHKQMNKKTWFFGLNLRWAVILHGVMLLLSAAGHIACACKGNKDTVLFPVAVTVITLVAALACGLGVWQRSEFWLFIASITSGVLFVSAIAAFIHNLVRWNSHEYEHNHPVLEVVMNLISVYLGLMNMFNCIAYRNLIISESLPTHKVSPGASRTSTGSRHTSSGSRLAPPGLNV